MLTKKTHEGAPASIRHRSFYYLTLFNEKNEAERTGAQRSKSSLRVYVYKWWPGGGRGRVKRGGVGVTNKISTNVQEKLQTDDGNATSSKNEGKNQTYFHKYK